MKPAREVIADEFCANGFCTPGAFEAPCDHAKMLADIALTALSAAGWRVVPEDMSAREAFSAGFWAYCGPANQAEFEKVTADEQRLWDEWSTSRMMTVASPRD